VLSQDIVDLKLSKPPLAEAIFELRWKLKTISPGFFEDPQYQIFVGRFQADLEKKFPFWEKLPASTLPANALVHVPHHRFRVGKEKWPLVQIGPGLLTVNQTEKYTWTDFKATVLDVVKTLAHSYPDSANILHLESVQLRYINGDVLNDTSPIDFLRDKMSVNVELPDKLFADGAVKSQTQSFNMTLAFKSSKPAGEAKLTFAQGMNNQLNQPALVWESTVTATGNDVPEFPNGIADWITKARAIAHHWFLTLTEQNLLESYK
jgi:hypothetical protein